MHEGLPHFAEVVMPLKDERTTSRYGYATFSIDTGEYAWYGPNRALNWSNGGVLIENVLSEISISSRKSMSMKSTGHNVTDWHEAHAICALRTVCL